MYQITCWDKQNYFIHRRLIRTFAFFSFIVYFDQRQYFTTRFWQRCYSHMMRENVFLLTHDGIHLHGGRSRLQQHHPSRRHLHGGSRRQKLMGGAVLNLHRGRRWRLWFWRGWRGCDGWHRWAYLLFVFIRSATKQISLNWNVKRLSLFSGPK